MPSSFSYSSVKKTDVSKSLGRPGGRSFKSKYYKKAGISKEVSKSLGRPGGRSWGYEYLDWAARNMSLNHLAAREGGHSKTRGRHSQDSDMSL